MIRLLLLLVLGLAFEGSASGQVPTRPPVDVRPSLDRTAIWVGDHVTYTIELVCGPDVDVLLEDLAQDRLQVTGGEIVRADAEESDANGRIVRRMRYTLTSYRVDAPQLEVAPFTVRYFSRAAVGAAAEGRASGQVTVPQAVIAIRSTLPGSGRLPELREPASLRPAPPYVRFADRAGILLIAIGLVPLVLLSVNLVSHGRRVWAFGRARLARRRQRRGFDDLRHLAPVTTEERIDAYARLDAAVREHLHLSTGIPAPALTPSEVRSALQHAGYSPAGDLEELLTALERARYAPEALPAEDWTDLVQRAERLARRRP